MTDTPQRTYVQGSTRELVRQLIDAGFVQRTARGSHEVWTSPDRKTRVVTVRGHPTQSPGCTRAVHEAIASWYARNGAPKRRAAPAVPAATIEDGNNLLREERKMDTVNDEPVQTAPAPTVPAPAAPAGVKYALVWARGSGNSVAIAAGRVPEELWGDTIEEARGLAQIATGRAVRRWTILRRDAEGRIAWLADCKTGRSGRWITVQPQAAPPATPGRRRARAPAAAAKASLQPTPGCVYAVTARRKNRRNVKEALRTAVWTEDLPGLLAARPAQQTTSLWRCEVKTGQLARAAVREAKGIQWTPITWANGANLTGPRSLREAADNARAAQPGPPTPSPSPPTLVDVIALLAQVRSRGGPALGNPPQDDELTKCLGDAQHWLGRANARWAAIGARMAARTQIRSDMESLEKQLSELRARMAALEGAS